MFELDIARQITEDRISDAARRRAARGASSSRRAEGGSARRRLGSPLHRGPGLARLWRPE